MKNIADIILAGQNNKRVVSLIILVTTCLVLGTIGTLWASIEESPHNPSPDNCRICHAQKSEKGEIALWNPSVGNKNFARLPEDLKETNNALTAESSARHDSKKTATDQHNEGQTESSKCLVCHNGIFGSQIKSNYPEKDEEYDYESNPDFWVLAEQDRGPSHNHPNGFVFDPKKDSNNNGFPEAIAMNGDPEKMVIVGRKSRTQYPLFGSDKNKFECLTCHTAHYNNNTNQGIKGNYQVKMLRADNTISAMCRDCHLHKY